MAIIKNVDRTQIPLDFLKRALAPGEEVFISDSTFYNDRKVQNLLLKKKLRLVEDPIMAKPVANHNNTPDIEALAKQMAQALLKEMTGQLPKQSMQMANIKASKEQQKKLIEIDKSVVIIDKKENLQSNLDKVESQVVGLDNELERKKEMLKALKLGGNNE